MPAASVEAYLAAVRPEQRKALERLAAVIQDAAPGAVRGISYGLIGFKVDGKPLLYIGAAKGHCALYGGIQKVVQQHADQIAGRSTSKGTLRFQPDDPLPDDLVRSLVQARVAEIRS